MPRDEDSRKPRSTSTSKGTKGSKKGKEGWTCSICTNDFTKDTDKVVQCEYCNLYYCNECLKLSDKDYEGFSNPSLHWFCPHCETKVIKNLRIDQEIEVRCTEFFKTIESRVTNIEKALDERPSINQVESMIAVAITNNDKVDSKQVSDNDIEASINSKVSEIRDSALREKNIIIYGIEEAEESEASARKKTDTDIVVDLFKFVETDPEIIKNVVRLGKRHTGDIDTAEENDVKTRPVKVTLSDNDGKQKLMKNLSKLKQAPEQSKFKKVSITHDMSKTEREQNKQKMLEAKTLNEGETSGKVKYIVRGPPWERKVVKIRIKET